MIFHGRGRPQSNIDKTDLRLFQKKKSHFFKVGAARKATLTKLTLFISAKITIFEGRGRSQGNIHKTHLCLFPKIHNFLKVGDARRGTSTKLTFVCIQNGDWNRFELFEMLK